MVVEVVFPAESVPVVLQKVEMEHSPVVGQQLLVVLVVHIQTLGYPEQNFITTNINQTMKHVHSNSFYSTCASII